MVCTCNYIHNHTGKSTTDVINTSDQPGHTSEDPSKPPPTKRMKLSDDGKSNENYVQLPTLGECLISYTIEKIIIIYNTRNELASLAHSFYTCLKHQLIHLTIVLLRSIILYLGFIVVWSFIPRNTLYCLKIHDRPRCGAAQRGRLNYITNANAHVHILD